MLIYVNLILISYLPCVGTVYVIGVRCFVFRVLFTVWWMLCLHMLYRMHYKFVTAQIVSYGRRYANQFHIAQQTLITEQLIIKLLGKCVGQGWASIGYWGVCQSGDFIFQVNCVWGGELTGHAGGMPTLFMYLHTSFLKGQSHERQMSLNLKSCLSIVCLNFRKIGFLGAFTNQPHLTLCGLILIHFFTQKKIFSFPFPSSFNFRQSHLLGGVIFQRKNPIVS